MSKPIPRTVRIPNGIYCCEVVKEALHKKLSGDDGAIAEIKSLPIFANPSIPSDRAYVVEQNRIVRVIQVKF